MTGQPETSGAAAILGEVVAAAPDALRPCGTHAAIKRHRKRGEALCDTCAEYQRTYNRDYYRQARNIDTFRQRHNARHRQTMRRTYADPAKVAEINARRRLRRQEAREQARIEARIDAVVIARLIDGEPVAYNRAERLEAVRQLRHRGLPYQQIATRLHVTGRQVHRDLTELGLVNPAGEVA